MPLLFIHGVNTRNTERTRREVMLRDAMIRRHLLDPLAARSPRFADLSIMNPYWGDHAEAFRRRARRTAPFVWLDGIRRRFESIGDRTGSADESTRSRPPKVAARFIGDALAYFRERGTPAAPGPIVRVIVDALETGARGADGEPMIVMTHSMGGNILHDVLTSFSREVHLDAWISVGGQVGVFQAFKTLATIADDGLDAAAPVPLNVTQWLNVYDPADPLALRAQRFFDNASDVPFKSGAGRWRSHSTYFERPEFFALVERALAAALI